MNSIIDDVLSKYIISVSHLNEQNIFMESQSEEFLKKYSENSLEYPAIFISEESDYSADHNQEGIDLENEIKANVVISIEIFCKSIDDIIHFENLFVNHLSCNYDLKEIDNDRCVKDSYLCLNKDSKPRRENIADGVFVTQIKVNCYDFILPKYLENPVRFELDQKTQVKVLKHLLLLESFYFILIEKYNSANNSVVNEKIINQIKQLEKQISEMFIFKDLCGENFSYKNHSFQYCYQLLTDKKFNADIKAIFALDEQRIKKDEEKRKQAADEKAKKEKEAAERLAKMRVQFSVEGDKQLNRYTNAVIQDFQAKLSLENTTIYGGTSFSKWYRQFEERSLTYPNILIVDSFNYDLKLQSYENRTADGNLITHNYDTCSLPVKYGIFVRIFSDSADKNKEIEQRIIDHYSEQKQIKLADFRNKDEFTVINLQVASDTEIERKQFGSVHRTIITFKQFCSVFYICGYSPEECENNQRQQLRLLQQAEYVHIKLSYYAEAKRQLSSYYKPLIERRHTLLGFLNSADYKKVKSLYNSGMPISKELFDSAMKPIVKYYPDLYQQFISGWSYAQIEQNMDGFINYYKTRFDMLMGLLRIPVRSTQNPFCRDQITYHTQEALIYFIKKMLDPYCELSTAISEYTTKKLKELEAKREQERIEREEREAMRAEQEAYGGGSSGSGILKTAAGVALGNRSVKKEVRKQNEILREQERNRERRQSDERSRNAAKSRAEYHRILKLNQERSRKGLPPLPLPDVDWY